MTALNIFNRFDDLDKHFLWISEAFQPYENLFWRTAYLISFTSFFSTWFFVRCCWKVARVSILILLKFTAFFWGLVSWTFVSTLEWDDQFRGTFDWKWILCFVVKELNDSKGFFEKVLMDFRDILEWVEGYLTRENWTMSFNGLKERWETNFYKVVAFFEKTFCWCLETKIGMKKKKTCFDMIEKDLKWKFCKSMTKNQGKESFALSHWIPFLESSSYLMRCLIPFPAKTSNIFLWFLSNHSSFLSGFITKHDVLYRPPYSPTNKLKRNLSKP